MAEPIVFERIIEASPDEAFDLLTQPERLRRWQAVSASVDLRIGGEYRLTVVPGNIASGTFTEIEPGRRLVYSWGLAGQRWCPTRFIDHRDRHRAGRRQDQGASHTSGPRR